MIQTKLNNDDLSKAVISRGRIPNIKGKHEYKNILRFPEIHECVLLDDVIKIISGKYPKKIQTYDSCNGGVYSQGYERRVYKSFSEGGLYIGCQFIGNSKLIEFKKLLKKNKFCK